MPAPPPTPESTTAAPAEELAHFETYDEVVAAFPKDVMGNVDWVAAVRDELVAPRPGISPAAEESPRLPFDVHLDPGIPQFEAVFPHEPHTYWLRCENCHPAIFQMRAGADPITMAKIFAGEYCGRCHGVVAFPPQTGCLRCHPKLGRASG